MIPPLPRLRCPHRSAQDDELSLGQLVVLLPRVTPARRGHDLPSNTSSGRRSLSPEQGALLQGARGRVYRGQQNGPRVPG